VRWIVEHVEGAAQALHDLPVRGDRLVRVHHVSAPALVLGSRQLPAEFAEVRDQGIDFATRRSGGGAVWLAPGEQLWVDVVVPAGDPLHSDDIRLAAHWMGDAWSAALGSHTRTWRSGVTNPSASAIACFAGVGPGEVTLHGRKLVGISQRRTRDWSRFQCVTYYRWVPEELLRLLGMPGGSEVARSLRRSVAVLGDLGVPEVLGDRCGVWTDALLDRLVTQLDVVPTT
jgi:lipoate-protein ligase A